MVKHSNFQEYFSEKIPNQILTENEFAMNLTNMLFIIIIINIILMEALKKRSKKIDQF